MQRYATDCRGFFEKLMSLGGLANADVIRGVSLNADSC